MSVEAPAGIGETSGAKLPDLADRLRTARRRMNRGEERPWTSREIAELRRLGSAGAVVVAAALQRSIPSVKMQAHRQGISLRPALASSRGGLVLGQPRSVSYVQDARLRALRASIISAPVPSIAGTEMFAGLIAQRDAPVCPGCGIRPQQTELGWCKTCHVKALTRQYEAQLAEAEAQRENDSVRQRRHRGGKT